MTDQSCFSAEFPILRNLSVSYKCSYIANKVIIVGAGGTGGRLMPLISQLLPNIPWLNTFGRPEIYLVDDDEVELKNIKRQLFIEPDIGLPKAGVMAERYSLAYGANIIPVINKLPIKTTEDRANSGLYEIIPRREYAAMEEVRTGREEFIPKFGRAIWVLAVDTMEARRRIIKMIGDMDAEYALALPIKRKSSVLDNSMSESSALVERSRESLLFVPSVILDLGNEDTFGQVRAFSVGNRYTPYVISSTPAKGMQIIDAVSMLEISEQTRNASRQRTALSEPPKVSREEAERIVKAASDSWFLNFVLQSRIKITLPFLPFNTRLANNLKASATVVSCAELEQTAAINNLVAATAFALLQNLYLGKPLTKEVVRVNLSGDNSSENLNFAELQTSTKYDWEGNRNPEPSMNIFSDNILKGQTLSPNEVISVFTKNRNMYTAKISLDDPHSKTDSNICASRQISLGRVFLNYGFFRELKAQYEKLSIPNFPSYETFLLSWINPYNSRWDTLLDLAVISGASHLLDPALHIKGFVDKFKELKNVSPICVSKAFSSRVNMLDAGIFEAIDLCRYNEIPTVLNNECMDRGLSGPQRMLTIRSIVRLIIGEKDDSYTPNTCEKLRNRVGNKRLMDLICRETDT